MEPAELGNPNCVKVVTDLTGHALYFSRAGIPHDRDGDVRPGLLRHLGIYAYRRHFLLDFVKWKQTPLENAEKLEQLRALEHGAKIHVVKTRATGLGVDTPEDAAAAEKSSRKGSCLRSGRSGHAARVAIKSGVNAILGYQIWTRPILHDPTVLHHDDTVKMMNRAETVRNDKRRFSPH